MALELIQILCHFQWMLFDLGLFFTKLNVHCMCNRLFELSDCHVVYCQLNKDHVRLPVKAGIHRNGSKLTCTIYGGTTNTLFCSVLSSVLWFVLLL